MAALSLEAFEVIHPGHPRGGFRFALFDFDGTLSLIRQGWQGIMIPMMVEILQETGSGESPAALEACVRDFVERLTGKQTIYQMIRLKEEVEQRGGVPLDPLAYKQIYNDRLWEHIRHRVAGLRDGTIT
ncbi:MAG TPA: HAD family hydrolase, partial [Armatimonadota bacterium]|nr:HAD family hydrolase [Armatimonadota bacterium]